MAKRKKTIWEVAKEAAKRVAAWPEWKKRAADLAFVNSQDGKLRKTYDEVL